MDCIGIGNMAFIAIINTIENITQNVVADGSPVFQIQHQRDNSSTSGEQTTLINTVQYFSEAHQNRVVLRFEIIF